MEKNSVIQIHSRKNLDKCYHGCLGFIESIDGNKVKVSIYHPKTFGKNADVQKVEATLDNVLYVGNPPLKPH